IAKFSRSDAERYAEFIRELDASADLLRGLVLQAPPNLMRGARLASLRELVKAGRLGNRLRQLPTEDLRTFLELLTTSAADYLDGRFDGELGKARLGFRALVRNLARPS